MKVLRWLHLSDFHFDSIMGFDAYDVESVLHPLVNWIENRRLADGPVDLLFITGDVGNKGHADDYLIAHRYLEQIEQAAQVEKRNIWIVPGNHDVDRAKSRALLRMLTNEEESSNWFFAAADNRVSHLAKFAAFQNFMASYLPDRPFAEGDVVHRPAVFDGHDMKLGILPLNSAWFANDDDDRGRLWIGGRIVRERAELLRRHGAEVIVGLTHHPLSDLHQSDTAGAWIKNECDILLRGHLHSTEVEGIVSEEGALLEIAAGATYQGSTWPCRAFLGSLDWRQRSILIEPIRHVPGPDVATWALDVEAFPGRARSGYSRVFHIHPNAEAAQVSSKREFPYVDWAEFPHADWTAVNRVNWLSAVVDWFATSYPADADTTMRKLLDHASAILDYSSTQPNLGSRVENLAKALIPVAEAQGEVVEAHHLTILNLLALGLNRELSHLFMLPRVDVGAMLEVPDYSRLLLATRQLGAGHLDIASRLAFEVGRVAASRYM